MKTRIKDPGIRKLIDGWRQAEAVISADPSHPMQKYAQFMRLVIDQTIEHAEKEETNED